jgi:hypothetical protein
LAVELRGAVLARGRVAFVIGESLCSSHLTGRPLRLGGVVLLQARAFLVELCSAVMKPAAYS